MPMAIDMVDAVTTRVSVVRVVDVVVVVAVRVAGVDVLVAL